MRRQRKVRQQGGLTRAELQAVLRPIAPHTRIEVTFVDGVIRQAIVFDSQGRKDKQRWTIQWDEKDSFMDGLLPDNNYADDIRSIRTVDPSSTVTAPTLASSPLRIEPTIAQPGAQSSEPRGAPSLVERSSTSIPHPPAGHRCCRREEVSPGLCAWHHPRMQAPERLQCTARNAMGKRCNERTLIVLDETLSRRVFESKVCWYHASEGARSRIRTLLCQRSAPANRERPVAPGPSSAISHLLVRDLVAAQALGTQLFIDVIAPETGVPRSTFVARLTRAASASQPAGIQAVARWCQRCDSWHAPSEDTTILDLPSVDATYFQVREATQHEVGAAEHGTPECIDNEVGSDADEDVDIGGPVAPAAADLKSWMDEVEREPLFAQVAAASPSSLRADVARHWFIYTNRPGHIHKISWCAVSQATRQEHVRWLRRLKECSPDLSQMPLARAAVEMVLRLAAEKQWRWSTIASKLSSVRSALRNLPLHTPLLHGIDVGADPYFAAAQQNAQKKARVESLHPLKSRPLSYEEYERVKRTSPVLAALTWWLAARAGDVRRLDPKNITLELTQPDDRGFVHINCVFTRGKGAFFWGPYTIHSMVPLADAKVIQERVREALAQGRETVCSLPEQAALSKAIAALPDSSLRSLRRGCLHFFATAGATDNHLQLLSGHRRKDTLLRYLEWGKMSSEAAEAARTRTALIADQITGAGADQRHPMWMGPFSGFCGCHGARTPPTPELFPRKPPSRHDLVGAPSAQKHVSWPLKLKPEIIPLDIQKAPTFVANADLRKALLDGMAYLNDETLLGATWAPLVPRQIPLSAFEPHHWQQIHAARKVVPLRVAPDGISLIPISSTMDPRPFRVRSACKGFPVEASGDKLRPVFEPLTNPSTNRERFPPLHYPDRQSRRAAVARARYAMQFDFASWYDQVLVGCTDHYVCRAKPTPIVLDGKAETFEYFGLLRVPMGASWSAHVMQTLTWSICEPILAPQRPTKIFTMIDNVLVCGDDAEDFADAVETFLARCDLFGAQLNDRDAMPRSRAAIIDQGRMERVGADGHPHILTFLGEEFSAHQVRNTPKNVNKLKEAFSRLQSALGDPTVTITRRQLAALIGLATWMAHTIEVPIRDHYGVLRLFARLGGSANGWDDPFRIDSSTVTVIGRLVGPLLTNAPVTPSVFGPVVTDNTLFDAVVITDASSSGLGAIVQFPHTGEVLECKRGWATHIPHSAWAEPIAATELVRWLRARGAKQLAVVSDHIALASGQRRPAAGTGAFSKAYYLNEFFRALYSEKGIQEVFFIDGLDNPADTPSRSTWVGDTSWHVRPLTDVTFPSLAGFVHPYASVQSPRVWWNV